MKVLAWVSCGVTSAVACKLALVEYGIENVELYYMKIDSAHEDNDRFLKDLERWYGKKINIVQSSKYRDQFEVIEHKRYINGAHGAPCTKVLKKEVRWKVEAEVKADVQVFGYEFDAKEINRSIRFKQQHPSTNPIFPLIEYKITKQACAEILLKSGIELPVMYQLGYHNNNCIGCVKGGAGYWNKIRQDFPEVFEQMANLEQEIGASCLKRSVKDADGSSKSERLFLKDLDPKAGRHEGPIVPNCGTSCEIKYAHIIDPEVEEILNRAPKQLDLGLF